MFENITLSFQSVWAHKVRSFLTMLGIIIGIAAIITIVSTIKGTNDQIKENLIGSGVNAVVVSIYQDDYQADFSYQSNPEGITPLTEEARQELLKLDKVEDASLFLERSWADGIYYQNTAYSGGIYGIDDHYLSIYGYGLSYGRLFTREDREEFRKVILIDEVACKTLFTGANPVGKTLEIQGETFTVVGVVAQKSSFTPVINSISDYWMYANQDTGKIFVPLEDWPIVYRFDEPQRVAVGAASTDDMTTAGQKVAEYLSENYVSSTQYSYRSEDLLEQAKQLQEMSTATNRQLIWIAGISLIVGGIGVMNIMLVTVTERTREIGLKKAIGAKKRRILKQFLTEASVLTSLGGILGVLAGIGLSKAVSALTMTPTAISIPAIFIAVAFSMIIGIVFGLIPAIKAAKLNPIEALRRE